MWHFGNDNYSSRSYKANTTIDSISTITASTTSATAYSSAMFTLNLENGTYTFSLGNVTHTNSNMTMKRMTLSYYVGNTRTIVTHIDVGTPQTITIQNEEGREYVLQFWISWADTITNTATFSNVMINKGSTALPYEPYGVGNWYIEKNIGKRVFTGDTNTEVWAYATSGGYPRVTTTSITDGYKYNDTSRHIGKFLCSHFTPNTTDYTGHCYQYQASYLFNPTSDISSVATWRTWLGSNPMTLYYQLDTPTTETITNTNLISQLDSIYNAKLKSGTNTITQTNSDLPFILHFKYYKKG